MAVIAYLSANRTTSIENPAQMQIIFLSLANVQFSLSEGSVYIGNLKWRFWALDLMQLANRDCCTIWPQ